METVNQVLSPEGAAKPAQNPKKTYETGARDRIFLPLTLLFCLLLVDTFCYHQLVAAGSSAAVFAWYALVLARTGPEPLLQRSNCVLLLFDLFLALTLGLTTSSYFRFWNSLALLVLLPLHTAALSGAARLAWWQPAMLWERLLLLFRGLFGNLGAAPSVLCASAKPRELRRLWSLALGIVGALVLLAVLVPVLSSADALFSAATADLRRLSRLHFSGAVERLLGSLALTPFLFGLLYSLRHTGPLETRPPKARPRPDALTFVLMLAALDVLYLLFLAVQSAGLFGGPEYLAQKGLSYAEWARSGFFQMVGVTALNLTLLMAALTLPQQAGRAWRLLRFLSGALVAESLVLLASAAWRMTLYVSAYGLSFKRLLTYWGMAMMALFFLTALRKVRRPDFSFCRAAVPLALAGWLVVNCIPVDYLVAKNQVDRYLSGESATISIHYLAYSLSYDTLAQLERLDPKLQLCTVDGGWWHPDEKMEDLLARRAEAAAEECADWQSWSLSAWLAAE